MPFFLAGRFDTRKAVLERIRAFLQGHNYPTYAEPNSDHPRRLVALVRTADYADAYPVEYATVEIEWQVRGDVQSPMADSEAKDHFELRWMDTVDAQFDVEQGGAEVGAVPDGFTPTFGLHQDETHPELGPNHFQTERPGDKDATRERVPRTLVGESPIAIVDYFLSVAPEQLAALRDELADRP